MLSCSKIEEAHLPAHGSIYWNAVSWMQLFSCHHLRALYCIKRQIILNNTSDTNSAIKASQEHTSI